MTVSNYISWLKQTCYKLLSYQEAARVVFHYPVNALLKTAPHE